MSGPEALLGVAAGAAGLLSLAIQLGKSAQQLEAYYYRYKDAPEDLRKVILDLQTMVHGLELLERHRQQEHHDFSLLDRCIYRCRECTTRIRLTTDKIGGYLCRSPRLGKVYGVFKEPEIRKLLDELEQAKSSLLLAF
jgi:hypothetical protein